VFYKELDLFRDTTDAIVDEKYLIENLKLSPSFIAKHSRQMGVFRRKPRMFFLQNVLEFLYNRAKESQRKVLGEQTARLAKQYEVNRMFKEIQSKYIKQGGKNEKEKKQKNL